MLQLIKKYLKTTPALFLLIAIFITSIWFREEKLIASGEESLSLFNTRDIWKLNGIWEEIGFGLPNPTYLPRIPISYIIQLLHLFIPLWLAQATIFVITIFIGITSMYYCVQELQPEDKKYKKINVPFSVSIF